MDKTTQHLVNVAEQLVDSLGLPCDRRVAALRSAIRHVEAAGRQHDAPGLLGDYGVKFVGVSAAGQAILKIVGGPEDGRRLFTPLRLLFPPLFKVSVDHTLWKGAVSNRVRRVEEWKGRPFKFPVEPIQTVNEFMGRVRAFLDNPTCQTPAAKSRLRHALDEYDDGGL